MDWIEEIATRIHSRERLMYKGQRIAPWQSRWEDLPKEVKGKYLEEAQQIDQLYTKAEKGRLLTINEWLDALGIDRAYKKDMKQTFEKERPSRVAQDAKTVHIKDCEWNREVGRVGFEAYEAAVEKVRAESEPKAEEGGLLTEKNIKKVFSPLCWDNDVCPKKDKLDFEREEIRECEDCEENVKEIVQLFDLTSRRKDAEKEAFGLSVHEAAWLQATKEADAEWEKEREVVVIHCQALLQRGKAECQKRVKKIFEEIECVWPSWKGAGWWQILRQKEGVKDE